MRKSIFVAAIVAIMLTLACVTVNVYFPAAEVQSAADKIVEEVHGTQSSSDESELTPKQSMLRRALLAVAFLESQAYAQVDIDITTPNIRALRTSLKERFQNLQPLYENGTIGETNDGLLSIRSLEDMDLKEKAEAKKLVKAENSDRENLYMEIVKANNIPSDSLSQVKELFANSWRKNAKKGWWIQQDDGDWVKKD